MAFKDRLMKLPVASSPVRMKPAPPNSSSSTPAQVVATAASTGALQLGSLLAPAAVVCLGLFVTSLESGGGRPVDRATCDCSCWDHRFKGRHGNSRIQYKNMYFNIRATTAVLFIWTAFWVKLLGAALDRIWQLGRSNNLRLAAFGTALFLFYPLFYGAWASWNYINEEWPLMLWSQLFFLATELLPAYCVCQLLDKQQEIAPAMATTSIAVSITHVALALKEKVLWGLIWSNVNTTNARDVMLMVGDVAVLAFFGRGLQAARLSGAELRQHLLTAVAGAVGLIVCYLMLFSYKLD